jgi:hypothetical protein
MTVLNSSTKKSAVIDDVEDGVSYGNGRTHATGRRDARARVFDRAEEKITEKDFCDE